MRRPSRKQATASWPAWAPSELRIAHDGIVRMSEADWERQEDIGGLAFEPAEYMFGIGTKPEAQRILSLMATDPRMKLVWKKIGAREAAVRRGTGRYPFLRGSQKSLIVCCLIASTVAKISAELKKAPNPATSKAAWKKHYAEVGKTAGRLAHLLECGDTEEGTRTQNSVNTYANLLSGSDVRTVAGEFYSVINSFYTHQAPSDLESDETLSAAQEEAEEREWDTEVSLLAPIVRDSLLRSAPSINKTLLEVQRIAAVAARNPPYLPPGNLPARIAYAAACTLSYQFLRLLSSPMDSTVATIVSVAFGKEIAPTQSRWCATGCANLRRNRSRSRNTFGPFLAKSRYCILRWSFLSCSHAVTWLGRRMRCVPERLPRRNAKPSIAESVPRRWPALPWSGHLEYSHVTASLR